MFDIRCFPFLILLAFSPALFAADISLTPQQTDFFEKKIRPLLVENCYKCHSRDSEKIKGGLLLDTRDGLLKGGDTGPGLIAGDVDKSLIIQAVRYTNKDLQMPPNDRQLETSQINDLEAWVKMGAPDPRTANDPGAHTYAVDIDKAKKHWAFQPITKPAIPRPDDPQHWEQTPVDNFILAGLLDQKLTPSPRADKVTLLRRVTFDLIGLPPSHKEVDDFLADNSTNAF
ncbi:MAG: Planctomycete cytochrome, partial [Pedosphaera sp.]|nr:Planctomycete cytochrome [Pedosphaera sp.]